MMNKTTLNLMAKEFLRLKEQIEALEAQKKEVQELLKEQGSIETDEVKISVSEFEVERMAGVEECSNHFGKERLSQLGLIKKSNQSRMTVKLKASASLKTA